MGMIRAKNSGSFDNIKSFAHKFSRGDFYDNLDEIGQAGVNALAAATPVDSGLAADSWTYDIKTRRGKFSIHWHNNDVEGGLEVVILIQYGHATGTGGYVPGRDFINPAMAPIFEEATIAYLEEVKNA